MFAQQKQADMQRMMEQLNMTANFVAAFLQDGIPPNKLDHPSIRGLIQKYGEVHGSLGRGATLYRNSDRVGQLHMGAICRKLQMKKVWVSTDEWTETLGHAIINVLLGTCGATYVCESKS